MTRNTQGDDVADRIPSSPPTAAGGAAAPGDDDLDLAAWLDGRVDVATDAQRRARLAVDPAFADEVEALRALLAAPPAAVPVSVVTRARALARSASTHWLARAAAAVLLGSAAAAGYLVAVQRVGEPLAVVGVVARGASAAAADPGSSPQTSVAVHGPAATSDAGQWFELVASESPLAAAILAEDPWR